MHHHTVDAVVERLLAAWRSASPLESPLPPDMPEDLGTAYAVQAALADQLGPIGGWKCGAPGVEAQPVASPLPSAGIIASPARLDASRSRLRIIEVEVGFRVAQDLPPRDTPYDRAEVQAVLGAILPVLEVVESRYAAYPDVPWPCQVADLQNHAGLVLGPETADWRAVDLGQIHARLTVDGAVAVERTNGNTAGDLFRPLLWLVNEGPARRTGLTAGQVITTGTLTGMTKVGPSSRAVGEIDGLGQVELSYH